MRNPFRRDPVTVEFVTPDGSPDVPAQVAEIDRHLLSIALIPAEHRPEGQRERADMLLDRRNRLRPPVTSGAPVIPGTTT